jgi:hypothetical protein
VNPPRSRTSAGNRSGRAASAVGHRGGSNAAVFPQHWSTTVHDPVRFSPGVHRRWPLGYRFFWVLNGRSLCAKEVPRYLRLRLGTPSERRALGRAWRGAGPKRSAILRAFLPRRRPGACAAMHRAEALSQMPRAARSRAVATSRVGSSLTTRPGPGPHGSVREEDAAGRHTFLDSAIAAGEAGGESHAVADNPGGKLMRRVHGGRRCGGPGPLMPPRVVPVHVPRCL